MCPAVFLLRNRNFIPDINVINFIAGGGDAIFSLLLNRKILICCYIPGNKLISNRISYALPVEQAVSTRYSLVIDSGSKVK